MHNIASLLQYCAKIYINDTEISINTAKSWTSILEASYVVYRLSPFHKNYNKRIVKMPKLYFYDTGLACSLLGLEGVAAKGMKLIVYL